VKPIKRLVTSGLRRIGYELVRRQAYEDLQTQADRWAPQVRDYGLLRALPYESAAEVLRLLPKSRAQFRQDLFVLSELGFKKGGYFVEFGATNGVDLSNTWLLEKEYGWTGILAEPARVHQSALRLNRSCEIDLRCVWSQTGDLLEFAEVESLPTLSTVRQCASGDMHGALREQYRAYQVPTVSLLDLLRDHDAPNEIDYLSVDTEGSELQILSAFDFGAYHISVITVEHNLTPARETIQELLTSQGYVRKFAEISFVDDWYVRQG
jgi:FkbM family methyltransferase